MKTRRWVGLGIAFALAAVTVGTAQAAEDKQGQGEPTPVAAVAASSAVDQPISRSEVITRAHHWLTAWNGGPVPYDQGRSFEGYRQDCSGFVSMAWRTGIAHNTVSLPNVSHRIAKGDLKPGDVIGTLGPGTGGDNGHVVIFENWANDAQTSYIGIEQAGSPGHTVRRAIPYPYFGGDTRYLPWRYNKIVDSPPADRVSDVNSDGFGDLVAVDANGELFGYNNASLVSENRVPFTSETWRVRGSNWSDVKHLASGDVTGDGFADLVGVQGSSLVVYANGSLVNPGGMPFGGVTWTYQGDWSGVRQLTVSDVTGDGFGDLVLVDAGGALVVYANGSKVNPQGRPFSSETWRIGGNWSGVQHLGSADINRDGFGDLVAVDANGELFGYNNASLVSGDRKPFTSETWRIRGGNWSGVRHFTVMDASGDGYADVVAVEADGSLSVYSNGSLVNPGGVPFGGVTWKIKGNWSGVRTVA
ncbi:VCBS repeat-containing protein [Lentzea tibetensis]|uniref:VCBS repeat-containing protein n=1 Tax=Lentzea tibetensis TaxID=2591470 RepID=A0A563EUC4_9PSEU|nr:VCBS repeat-containing protein [Lentzea tibetensis]TWP51305.1 VCBS repeat-containing protein [Lentzea tibetensis]